VNETRDGFLSRWSRLKRESTSEPRSELANPVSAPVPAAEEGALPEGKSLEQLIAELPRVEDLAPGQSLAAFMQDWVPSAVRNAALRRMWLLDAEIRDYVSPALDYAHDYNTPGAVPGFGTMETSEEAVREVSEMFDRALLRGRQDESSGAAAGCAESPQQEGEGPAANRSQPPPAIARQAEPGTTRLEGAADAARDTMSDPAPARPSGRRHGRALPS